MSYLNSFILVPVFSYVIFLISNKSKIYIVLLQMLNKISYKNIYKKTLNPKLELGMYSKTNKTLNHPCTLHIHCSRYSLQTDRFTDRAN